MSHHSSLAQEVSRLAGKPDVFIFNLLSFPCLGRGGEKDHLFWDELQSLDAKISLWLPGLFGIKENASSP